MRKTYFKTISIAIIVVFVLSLASPGKTQAETQDYTSSFLLWNHPDGDLTYELNVTIPQVLYRYYTMQNHALHSNTDFAKFITPYTLKPIADTLWQIYNNTEDFTNGVLMLVHQITYQEVIPGKYPVETLVAGYGDCDLSAYIAASILEAGGIPTVLLYYKTQKHMEIGVDLASTPKEARVKTYSINYQNTSYYIGECTGDNWRTGWRIGETPEQYQNISSQVVTLKNMEQTFVGQVSVSLRELDTSTLSLKIFPSILLENNNITVRGQILPQAAYENVTLQTKTSSGGWTTVATVATQTDGVFEYNWAPTVSGIVAIQATWQGNRQFNGATSGQTSVIILPLYILLLIVALVLALATIVLLLRKTAHRRQVQPQPIVSPETALSLNIK
jgi:hypothetical protein